MTTPTTAEQPSTMPDVVYLRDTGLHDDLGGSGQRIFTTAGNGYTKTPYVRQDLLTAARATIARLEGELDKAVKDFADVVAGRVGVKEIMVRDGKLTMTMHTEMASVLADSLAAMLDHGNAENYVEMDMRGSDGKRYTVIVRRAERPTPHELHMKAVAERDAERTRADAAERRGEVMAKGLKAVEALINESHGVIGLHLNGDDAPWEDLRTGGSFEEWLREFDTALAAASGAAEGTTTEGGR